jgi:hypothetical protein
MLDGMGIDCWFFGCAMGSISVQNSSRIKLTFQELILEYWWVIYTSVSSFISYCWAFFMGLIGLQVYALCNTFLSLKCRWSSS